MSHSKASPSVEFFPGAHNFHVERQYISVSTPSSQSPVASAHEIQQLLSPIPGASHTRNMKRSPPDSTCLPGTRTTLLSSITAWVKSSTVEGAPSSVSNKTGWEDDYGYYHYHPPSIKPVVWLCGPVGCGKSAIAHIVAKVAEDEGCLAASFFFFRGSGDRSRIARLAATLASQIAEAFPETLPHILDALKRSFSLQGASVETQFERLIYNPVLAGLGGRIKRPILILIDGLDECEDRAEVEEFIDHMLNMLERHPHLPLRFFISSRIEEHIREHIEVDKVHVVNLRDHHSDKDISTLVRHTFKVAASRNRVIRSYGKWPSEDEISALIRHARGSFIFIRTLLNFILGAESTRSDKRTPMERFELALRMDPGLDELYTGVLQDALTITHSTNIILTLAMLKEPLSISNLARLLDIRPFEVANALIPLQSIVHVPGDDETRVTLFHTSLREFIRNQHRSHSIFQETARSEHRNLLAQRCFQLRFQNKENGGNTFPYAVHYWADHWQDTYSDLKDLRARMDLITAAARNVPAPIPLVLSMVPFEAQIRTRRSNDIDSGFLFDWLSDAMGNTSPALHMVRQLVHPLYQSEEVAACDPSLHKCTVMHIMRCVMSHTWRPSYFWYIARHFSWNVLCIVNTDDGGSGRDTASFLQTPYQQEHAPPGTFRLGAETAAFTATSVYLDLPRNDDRLEGAADIINRKYLGFMTSYERGASAEEIPDHYIIYKEKGLCVLDMIHVLQRLRIAQDLGPETKHVLTYIGDGNIICFSTHSKARANADYSSLHVIRFNLYTDNIFELFSTHSGAA